MELFGHQDCYGGLQRVPPEKGRVLAIGTELAEAAPHAALVVIARSASDEAIHTSACCNMDCFDSLAMTVRMRSCPARGISLAAAT